MILALLDHCDEGYTEWLAVEDVAEDFDLDRKHARSAWVWAKHHALVR